MLRGIRFRRGALQRSGGHEPQNFGGRTTVHPPQNCSIFFIWLQKWNGLFSDQRDTATRTFICRLVVRECLDRPWTDRRSDTQDAVLALGYGQPSVAWRPWERTRTERQLNSCGAEYSVLPEKILYFIIYEGRYMGTATAPQKFGWIIQLHCRQIIYTCAVLLFLCLRQTWCV